MSRKVEKIVKQMKRRNGKIRRRKSRRGEKRRRQ